jgi:hypothetical protein
MRTKLSAMPRQARFAAAALAAFLLVAPADAIAQTVPAKATEKAAPAVAPAKVTLRVWPHQGYGRIVFDWPRAAKHKINLTNRALKVSFDAPFDAPLAEVPSKLKDYAAGAVAADEGRAAIITLKPGIRYKSFVSGNSIVLDLLPASTKKAAESASTVPVRVGAHATFSRFVFDWPRTVDYKISGSEIRFSRKGNFDLAAIRGALPPLVRAIASKESEGGTAISLTLADGAELRHFRTGMSVVVDVLRAEASPAGAAKSAIAAKPAKVAKAEVKAPATPPVKAAPRGPVALFDMSGKAANPLAERLVHAEKAPTSLLPSAQGGAATDQAKAAPAPQMTSVVPVILRLESSSAVMKFHWPQEVGAAVFERAGYLWAVFDREARLAFEGWDEAMAKPSPNSKRRREENPVAAFIARPKFSSMPGTTVFRMKIPDGVNPRVERDKAAWVVTLEREHLRPASGIVVEAHLAAVAGARLFIDYADAGQAVAVSDPEVGDRIWVVPLTRPEKGIGLARRMAEVELFATAQGIAGRALGDDIIFRTLPKGVEISARQGLTLSGVNVAVSASGKAESADKGLRPGQTRPGWLFDFESWRRESLGSFVENKHVLQREAAMAPVTARNAKRLELAQLYFAYDNLTDVLGLLQVIEQDEPELAQEAVFRAMRGAAYYRLGDYERATRDLGHNSLDGFREIALWRAALAAASNDWPTASRYFSRAESIMRVYPMNLRMHFGLLAAEASLNIGDVGLAKFHLDTLDGYKPSRRLQAQIDYLRGRLLARVLDPDGAIAVWTRAIAGPDRQIRVLATLARTDLRLEKEKMTKAEAVEEIEKLRYAWRGDELEFKVLSRLGRAYLEINDYKNGLMTYRELATNYPKHPDADKVIDTMRGAFIKLYVDGAADKIAPLTALALYDQFRELTPEGEVGDKLISQLAERLVAVDLLDRSATLLRHLVDQRLKGRNRFDAANRLALVYLLDRKPQDALDALAGQVPADVIPQWATTRRHLKARALAELARYKDGLDLLAGDTSLDADILRGEIFWKLRDWTNASLAYDRILKITVPEKAADATEEPALDEDAQRNVLSLAIAYALGRNQSSLKSLRQRYLGRMAKGPFKESFDIVTAPSGNIPDDYRVISGKVAEVDQFRSFLKSYRDKLMSRGKPATPRPGPSAAASPEATTQG